MRHYAARTAIDQVTSSLVGIRTKSLLHGPSPGNVPLEGAIENAEVFDIADDEAPQ
jgi:hypothetical protein